MDSHLIHGHRYDFENDHRGSAVALISRVLDLAFGALYTLLLIRFALVFFAARSGAGFYQFIHNTTQVFYRPFEGLIATSFAVGGRVEWSLLVAILAYAVLHAGIRGVLHLITRA
jgi:hypothetical protein